jgi:UDP-N-acetyl-D-galactosamine dehydrogenase
MACETLGKVIARGTVIVFESTVYPGATEEVCAPVIEAVSGLKAGVDFKLGYSPERINPGDKEHPFEKIVKVVAGEDGPRSTFWPISMARSSRRASTRPARSRWPRRPR